MYRAITALLSMVASNNAWTLAQNLLITRHLGTEDARRHAAQATVRRSRAPTPGQKPYRVKKRT